LARRFVFCIALAGLRAVFFAGRAVPERVSHGEVRSALRFAERSLYAELLKGAGRRHATSCS
jgi:hypothetical protein